MVQRQQRLVRAHAAPQPVAGLHKERKRLAKALKAHRNRLHKLANSAVDSPDRAVLADLVAELERLHAALEAPAAAPRAARRAAPAAEDHSSCCPDCRGGLEEQQGAGEPSGESDAEVADDCAELDAAACAALRGGRAGGSTLLVHTLGRTIELAAPQLEELEERAPPVYLGAGTVAVCQGGKCQRQGAAAVLQQVAQLAGGSEGVQVAACKCLGRCGKAPALKVKQEGQPCAVYTQVTPATAGFVLDRHFERQGQRSAGAQGAERLMA
jgi:(2Fe-2S) ferredoxin